MSFNDPNQRPRQPYMQGMNPQQDQMRPPMYNQQMQQQQQHPQQQHFGMQQQQQRPPPGGPGGPMQSGMKIPAAFKVTEENCDQWIGRLPSHFPKEKYMSLPMPQRIHQVQQILIEHQRRQHHMRANAAASGNFPQGQQQQPQSQMQQPPPQRFQMAPLPGGADVQGGYIPGPDQKPSMLSAPFPGQDQKPPMQQAPFPGPPPQQRKGPSPAAAAAPIFPGPGPSAQNPSTIKGPPSQPPQNSSQPPLGLHQSQSQPSFNIQASQPPPQNLPNPPEFKFGGQIKNEPPQSQPQPPQQNFAIPTSQQQQPQQQQPPFQSSMITSQSQPNFGNQNVQSQPDFKFQNQLRPEMSQQMPSDFGGPNQMTSQQHQHQQRQQQPNQMMPPQQQHQFQQHQSQSQQGQMLPPPQQQQPQPSFNIPTSQPMNQIPPPMGQPMPQQQQPFQSQQPQPMEMGRQQQQPQQPPMQINQQPMQMGQQQPQTQQMQNPQQLLQPRSQQSQCGPLSQQQQSQGGPLSQQPMSQQQQQFIQGPSPNVSSNVVSGGRIPTPTNKSVQSGGTTVNQEMINSKEYQETFARLHKYRDLCYRLFQRMRSDGDQSLNGMKKTIDCIEGKMHVNPQLMEKLIKNINTVNQRYDIASGLRNTIDIINKVPSLNMSQLIPDPYEKYNHLRISAPKEYYQEADDAKNDRQQQQYLKKRLKWLEENDFWDGSEPTPYPWKLVVRQYTAESLAEINQEYNEKMAAPVGEITEDEPSVQSYLLPEKEENNKNQKVQFNAEIEYLCRVDAYPPEKNNDYDEKESDEDDDEVIGVDDEEIEIVDEDEPQETQYEIHPYETFNNGNNEKTKGAFYDKNGELQQYTKVSPISNEGRKREIRNAEGPPAAKKIKVEGPNPTSKPQEITNPPYDFVNNSFKQHVVKIPAPQQSFEFKADYDNNGDPETSEDMEISQSYEAYLKRQQNASYYSHLGMNTQMVQDELHSGSRVMPIENYYKNPVMDPPPHEKPDEPPLDCPYSCCAPYELDSTMGKPAKLPQAAATELRRFRHRVDYENQPLSEHSPFYSIIINPAKANAKYKYSELRISIPQDYPVNGIEFQIVKPSSIRGKATNSFYEKLEKKMFERRLCGVSLHTISEVVSAFRYCVEFVHTKRDILDFTKVDMKF